MIAYLDSSVLLRMVLGQPGRLTQWKRIETGVTSALTEVECLRTLDRLRLAEGLDDSTIAVRREALFGVLDAIELVAITRTVLERAAQPMPTVLGTLDAIHLSTALLWRAHAGASELYLATHDAALGIAARASGLRVIGL